MNCCLKSLQNIVETQCSGQKSQQKFDPRTFGSKFKYAVSIRPFTCFFCFECKHLFLKKILDMHKKTILVNQLQYCHLLQANKSFEDQNSVIVLKILPCICFQLFQFQTYYFKRLRSRDLLVQVAYLLYFVRLCNLNIYDPLKNRITLKGYCV